MKTESIQSYAFGLPVLSLGLQVLSTQADWYMGGRGGGIGVGAQVLLLLYQLT